MARSSFRENEDNRTIRDPGGDQQVVQGALDRLSRYSHFRAHVSSISLEFRDGTLTVTGTLHSFYLKQVLQTVLRDLPGVVRIDNRVEVLGVGKPPDAHFSRLRSSKNEPSG